MRVGTRFSNLLGLLVGVTQWVVLGMVAGFVGSYIGTHDFHQIMLGGVYQFRADVTSTTFLNDAKIVYGLMQDQVSSLAILINLFDDGSKFAKPINDIGIKGYVFLARMTRNYNMGFRKEGVTGVGSAGAQGLQNGTINLKYAYIPTLITGQAQNLTQGQNRAFMQAKALEAKFDMKDIMAHVNVVVAGAERGGQLAQVLASPAPGAGTFSASTAGLLPGALYLQVGMPIDTAAVGGGALSVNNSAIATINYGTGAVTHAAGTAVAGEAVTLAGEMPTSTADFPLTCECLQSLISDTGAIEGLNPATAGQSRWASFVRDVGAVQITPALLMEQAQFTKNRGGENPNMYLVPSAQINQYVAIATATLRFDVVGPGATVGKKALDLGFSVYDFAGKPMIEDKDLRNDRIQCGASETMAKFEAVPLSMANDGAGEWVRVSGTNGIADAVQGLMRWYFQIGIFQRSAWSVYKNYTVPTAFSSNPATL